MRWLALLALITAGAIPSRADALWLAYEFSFAGDLVAAGGITAPDARFTTTPTTLLVEPGEFFGGVTLGPASFDGVTSRLEGEPLVVDRLTFDLLGFGSALDGSLTFSHLVSTQGILISDTLDLHSDGTWTLASIQCGPLCPSELPVERFQGTWAVTNTIAIPEASAAGLLVAAGLAAGWHYRARPSRQARISSS